MINFPQVTLIYDRYKKASSLRTATIEVRISYNRKQKYISTGIRVLQSQWRKGRIANSPNSVMLNMELDNILNKVRQDIYDMYNKGSIDIFSISSKVKIMMFPVDYSLRKYYIKPRNASFLFSSVSAFLQKLTLGIAPLVPTCPMPSLTR